MTRQDARWVQALRDRHVFSGDWATMPNDSSGDPLGPARLVIAALETLGIAYAVGGSIASSAHGEPRFTADVGLAVDLRPESTPALASALESEFLVPARQLTEAVREASSFSVVHIATARKVDLFVVGSNALARAQIERRRPIDLDFSPGQLFVISPEDVVLQKLVWFDKGGRTSDQQWRDILGVLKLQGERLDRAYLRRWATETRTEELLNSALVQAGLAPIQRNDASS